MDLLITTHNNGEITFNSDELKQQIAEFASQYDGLVYTDANIKDAKKDRTEVRKAISKIDDRRKEVKKAYMDGYNKFEKEVKECLAPLTDLETKLKNLSDEYEENRKAKKMDEIKAAFAETEFPFPVSLESVFRKEWLNASESIKAIKDDLNGDALNFKTNMDILDRLPNGDYAIEVYKETLDMGKAMNEADRLARVQKAKEEAEKAKEEAKKAPAPEPPKEEMPLRQPENLTEAHFTVIGTISQVRKVRDFIEALGVIWDGDFEDRTGMGGAFH